MITHLHWAYTKPHLLKGTTTGVALCGERGVPNQQLTSFPKYTTCQNCKTAYRRQQNDHSRTTDHPNR